MMNGKLEAIILLKNCLDKPSIHPRRGKYGHFDLTFVRTSVHPVPRGSSPLRAPAQQALRDLLRPQPPCSRPSVSYRERGAYHDHDHEALLPLYAGN